MRHKNKILSGEIMRDKTLNKIISKAAAMKMIDRFEYLLALNKEDKEFCGTLKDTIENIKEYHKID